MKTSAFVMALLATMGFADLAAARDLRVAGALVTGKQDGALVWNARWVLAQDELDTENRVTGDIRFAAPLPEGETMILRHRLPAMVTPNVTPIVEEGHIVGVHVDGPKEEGRTVEATFVQKGVLAHAPLGIPLADGNAIQIVDTDLGAGTRIELDRDRALERRVAHAAREEAVRLTGYTPQPSDTALYVRGSDVRAAGGLRGSIVSIGERTSRMSAIAAGVFGVIVIALVAGWYRLKKRADAERADAILAERIESL